jgi:hypothetical protein
LIYCCASEATVEADRSAAKFGDGIEGDAAGASGRGERDTVDPPIPDQRERELAELALEVDAGNRDMFPNEIEATLMEERK